MGALRNVTVCRCPSVPRARTCAQYTRAGSSALRHPSSATAASMARRLSPPSAASPSGHRAARAPSDSSTAEPCGRTGASESGVRPVSVREGSVPNVESTASKKVSARLRSASAIAVRLPARGSSGETPLSVSCTSAKRRPLDTARLKESVATSSSAWASSKTTAS